jgi:hypothetical protein
MPFTNYELHEYLGSGIAFTAHIFKKHIIVPCLRKKMEFFPWYLYILLDFDNFLPRRPFCKAAEEL